MAKKGLLKSMANFQRDMEKCAGWAEDTQAQFDALVKCVGEVNLAMADETGKGLFRLSVLNHFTDTP